MNKKISFVRLLFVLAALTIFLVGCTGKKSENTALDTSEKKLKVVTTVFAPYDFARQVAKDNAEVTLLLKPGAESHSYEPTPQDIITIGKCDVFVYVGGESDKWVDKVLSSVNNKDMKIIKLLDCVDAVEEELKEGMQEEKEEESEHSHEDEKEWDEHVWTSPVNAGKIAAKMQQVFSELDPEHKDEYKANYDAYQSELTKVDTAFKDVVKNAKRKTVVFGDRFPLRYFVEEYGLEYFAAFPGCSTDTDVSAATIAFLNDKINQEKIPVVFKIELSNGTVAKSIADSTKTKVLTFYSCHNISKDDYNQGMTYVDFMWKNVDSLKEALN